MHGGATDVIPGYLLAPLRPPVTNQAHKVSAYADRNLDIVITLVDDKYLLRFRIPYGPRLAKTTYPYCFEFGRYSSTGSDFTLKSGDRLEWYLPYEPDYYQLTLHEPEYLRDLVSKELPYLDVVTHGYIRRTHGKMALIYRGKRLTPIHVDLVNKLSVLFWSPR